MRILASFEDPAAAQALDELLSAADIPTIVRDASTASANSGARAVWVVSEQDLPKAQQLLATFLSHPSSARRTAELGTRRQPAQQRKPNLIVQALQSPVTSALFVACTAVAIYTALGDNRERVAQFQISSLPKFSPVDNRFSEWSPWDDLRSGQIWRAVTPILLHFHPFHLLFNAFWLRDLGVPCERFQGSRQYAVFLLWSAVVSNVAQLAATQLPNFGGLSGVVYALMGYLWARGRFDPTSGIRVPTSWVVFFVGWMLLGFTGLLERGMGISAANYCHLGGFAAGIIYGSIGAMVSKHHARS